MKVLAVVPARGGSKGIPGKNLRRVCGRPLIAWSIAAAQAPTRLVDRVVVSTDDPAIAAAATELGAEVLDRPAELATDQALTDPVLLHAVSALGEKGYRPDLVVLLQPTVPVRADGLVDACIERMIDTEADSLLTAYPLHFVWWQESPAYRYDSRPTGTGSPAPPAWRTQCPRRPRRQDMQARELMWHEDGSVFVTRTELLERTGCRIGGHVEIFETARTVDVDTPADLAIAGELLRHAELMRE